MVCLVACLELHLVQAVVLQWRRHRRLATDIASISSKVMTQWHRPWPAWMEVTHDFLFFLGSQDAKRGASLHSLIEPSQTYHTGSRVHQRGWGGLTLGMRQKPSDEWHIVTQHGWMNWCMFMEYYGIELALENCNQFLWFSLDAISQGCESWNYAQIHGLFRMLTCWRTQAAGGYHELRKLVAAGGSESNIGHDKWCFASLVVLGN